METDVFDEIQRLRALGIKAALATIVQIRDDSPVQKTAKMLIRDDGSRMGTLGANELDAEVWSAAQRVIQEKKSRLMNFKNLDVFVEPVLPTPKIVILGAGHVAIQVSKIATIAGFTSTIVDDRSESEIRSLFPEAEAIYAHSFERLSLRSYPMLYQSSPN